MFSVNRGGIDSRHQAPFFMSFPKGSKDHVLLITKAAVSLEIEGMLLNLLPGSAIFIRPNVPYQYHSVLGYSDDWLHFDFSPEDARQVRDIPFHRPIPLPPSARCTQYIQDLLWENSYAPAESRAENVDLLFRVLLNNIRPLLEEKNAGEAYSPYRARLQNLRLEIQAQPWKKYAPREISDSLGISISYFQHQYAALFGVSFQADLISLRIEYAKDLIANTDLTMEMIAQMSGYCSEVHFYRQFKKYTGTTPASFRKR